MSTPIQREAAEAAHANATEFDRLKKPWATVEDVHISESLWKEYRRLQDVVDGRVDPTTIPEITQDNTVPLRAPAGDKSRVNEFNDTEVYE